jgi:hypothetical protein
VKKLLRVLVWLVIATAILSSGVPLALIVIAVAVWFFFRRRRRSGEGQASAPKVQEPKADQARKDRARKDYAEFKEQFEEGLDEVEGVPPLYDFSQEEGYDRRKASSYVARKTERQHIPRSLKYAVLKRDNRTCQLCGAKAPDVELHIDHIVPLSKGGTTTLDNLQVLCADCNLGKGNSDDTDWRASAGD